MRLLALSLLLLAAPAGSAPAYKRVQDWVAACDNTRRCAAIGFSPAGASPAWLRFERGGKGSDSVHRIVLRSERRQHWILQADGAELLRIADDGPTDADGDQVLDLSITDEGEIAALLAAIRDAHLLTLIGDGEAVGRVSLSGATAILLWIDEQQQRLGTRTALLRWGDKSPSGVPDPPAAKAAPAIAGARALDDAAASRLAESVRGTLEADTCGDPDPGIKLRDRAWSLADGRTLVQLRCWAAAYNFGSRWFLVAQGTSPAPIAFPVPSADDGGTITDLVNADFDPESGRLRMLNKGRGPGDCGSSGEWAWTGVRFELIDFRMMSLCRGMGSELWPQLWRIEPPLSAP